MAEAADHEGHRDRLRRRFMEQGADALADYELLELLLFAAVPRRDTKPVAKELLRRFGSLAGVMAAPPARLKEVALVKDSAVVILKANQALAQRMLKREAAREPLLSSFDAVLDHLKASMAHEGAEMFRILFLDRKNRLVADEVQQRGTVDHAPVYPREVAKRALEVNATAVILVHNHPSGDPTPSRADIAITKEVAAATGAVGVIVHDHIVIARDGYASFRALGLL